MIRIFKLVLLLVVSQVAFGQAPSNYTNINGRYRWIAGMFDSTFHIPKGTTPSLRTGGSTNSGGLFYNTSDSSVYTYTGTQWIKVRGSLNPSDTSNKYITQVYKKSGSDSVFYVKGGTHTWAFNDSTGAPGGGGGGKIYYFNGGVNMGTFGGFTMYELGDTANTGSAANFTRATTGAIANFITDPNKPGLLQIPAGVWTIDAWLSESGGGANHAEIWAVLEKWNGSTITTIATSPIEEITEGNTPNLYTWAITVPTTTLAVTDRIIIQFYITNTNGKTVTLYTQNGYVGEVHTTFTTGIGALNGLTAASQYLTTGTSGTDFNISSVTATHTFNLPTASATNRGALSSTDWTTFNSKLSPADTVSLSNRINLKLNISDTAAMLSPYARTNVVNAGLATKVNISDTASMLSPYARKNFLNAGTGISYSSTTGTIANTAPDQTVALNAGTGISISGTYPNFTITNSSPSSGGTVTSVGSNTGTGLTGGPITTSGTLAIDTITISTRAWRQKGIDSVQSNLTTGLALKVNISDTASMLNPYLRKIDTASLSNRINLKLNISDTASMLSPYLRKIDTASLSNRINLKVNISDTANMLNPYLRKVDTASLSNRINTKLNISDTSTMLGNYVNNVGYGLSKVSQVVSADSATLASYFLRRKDSLTATNLLGYVTGKILADTAAAVRAAAGGGSIGGSGTTNYVAKFTSSTAVGNSQIFDNGTNIGIATTALNNFRINVAGHYAAETASYNTDGAGDSYRSGIGWQAAVNSTSVLSTLITTISEGNFGGNIVFLNRNTSGGNLNERMRITSGGALILSGSLTASSAIARAALLQSTLTAAANNDYLVALDIAPTYTVGAFTNVRRIDARMSNGILIQRAGTTGSTQSGLYILENPAVLPSSIDRTCFIRTAGGISENLYINAGLNAGGTAGNVVIGGDRTSNNGVNTITPGSAWQVNGNCAIGYSASTAAPTNGLAVAGNVSIGVNSATYPLTVRTAGTNTGHASAGNIVQRLESTATGRNVSLQFSDNVTNATFISMTDGNMLFTTAAPASVNSLFLSNTGIAFFNGFDVSATPSTAIVSATGGTGSNVAGAEFRIRGGASTGSGAGGPITFYTSAAGSAGTSTNAATERMRITSGGNVGINTSTPTTYGLSGSHIENFGGSNYAFIHNNTTTVKSFFASDEANLRTVLYTYSNHPLLFGTNNTERMRITSGGSVGIGTTTIGSTLQVNGNAAIGYSASTAAPTNGLAVAGNVGIATNTPTGQSSNNSVLQIVGAGTGTRAQVKLTNATSGNTGTDGLMLSFDDQLDGYLYNFENGNLIFGTNNSERMRITSGGNVGIGINAPTSAFHTNGSVAAKYVSKTATYTLDATDYTVVFNVSSAVTANLPDATTCTGRIYVIKVNNTTNTDAVTIDPNGAQTIDGNATYTIQCQYGIMIQSDGTNWRIIADFGAGLNCL